MTEARLGETLAEVNRRYGIPTKNKEPESNAFSRWYEFNGFKIQVGFLNGKSILEHYSPAADDGSFTELEIDTLLSANNLGSKWKITSSARNQGESVERWSLESGVATATCSNGFKQNNTLLIQMPEPLKEWYQIYDKRREEENAKRLKGF